MFLNEARLAARLNHPNIVSIFDLGETNGHYYIAMEFIDGPDAARPSASSRPSAARACRSPIVCKIVSLAAGGLQYAHDLREPDGQPLGLVHRDISPDNILVHRNGAVKVVDFGIAKAANSAAPTRTGTLKGKVAYMPPEQIRGERLDRRADVFALGVGLYELLAGASAVGGHQRGRADRQDHDRGAGAAGAVAARRAGELCNIVEKALAKDRAQRYQSCHELQADLEALMVEMGQTITPSRISDFVKAYSPEPQSAASMPEQSSAEIQQIENEMNGTGAAPALVKGRGKGAAERDSRTVAMAAPPKAASGGSGLLYGVLAFLVIAAGGGVGGYLVFFHQDEPGQAPVAVERAAVVEVERKPAETKPAPAAPPAEPEKPAVAEKPASKPAESHPRPHKIAQVETPPPVVIVKEAPKPVVVPEPPKPTVVAKGELVLLVRPWAKIEVDGREVGVTPLNEPLMLAAGDHKVRLINPDFQKDITRTVHIKASEKEVLKEILDE